LRLEWLAEGIFSNDFSRVFFPAIVRFSQRSRGEICDWCGPDEISRRSRG
jgi:hypothetical protein